MIASWHDDASEDTANPEVKAQKPRFHGLNDCAHFVTRSLRAGDIHVETPSVPRLFERLRARSDTKTLAKTVTAHQAEHTIDSGIMKPGDVIIYSTGTTHHHHSAVYMGDGKIAMHTWANHPDNPETKGDWESPGVDDDERVTLIHFSSDDPAIPPESGMFGWWKVCWFGEEFFYLFEKTGRVLWSRMEPKNHKLAIAVPGGRGYWFQDADRVAMCWTDTGTFEELSIGPHGIGTHLDGLRNGTIPLDADQLQ
jgi:NlpC/P60 family